MSRILARTVAIVALIAPPTATLIAAEEKFTFVTRDGEEFEGVTVSRRTPDGVAFRTDSGVSKVRFERLPDHLQARFEYDPEETREYRERRAAETAARREAARRAELKRRAQREREELLPELDTTLSGTVAQILKDGVLLRGSAATRPGIGYRERLVQTDGPTTLSPHREREYRTVVEKIIEPQPIELGSGTTKLVDRQLAKTALDGQQVSVLVYPIGRFHYIDRAGNERTVACFTTEPETAARWADSEFIKSRLSPID